MALTGKIRSRRAQRNLVFGIHVENADCRPADRLCGVVPSPRQQSFGNLVRLRVAIDTGKGKVVGIVSPAMNLRNNMLDMEPARNPMTASLLPGNTISISGRIACSNAAVSDVASLCRRLYRGCLSALLRFRNLRSRENSALRMTGTGRRMFTPSAATSSAFVAGVKVFVHWILLL